MARTVYREREFSFTGPETGLTGKALADALYDFVRDRYPNHVFHYEAAREALQKTGVDVKGTGATTRGALKGAGDRFEKLPDRTGRWRWK